MATRPDRHDKIAFVLISCMLLILTGVAVFVLLPTRPLHLPADRPATPTPQISVDGDLEKGFCSLLAAAPDLDPRIATELSRSPAVHYMLAQLAAAYGREPTPGAREQLLTECRRLKLIS